MTAVSCIISANQSQCDLAFHSSMSQVCNIPLSNFHSKSQQVFFVGLVTKCRSDHMCLVKLSPDRVGLYCKCCLSHCISVVSNRSVVKLWPKVEHDVLPQKKKIQLWAYSKNTARVVSNDRFQTIKKSRGHGLIIHKPTCLNKGVEKLKQAC